MGLKSYLFEASTNGKSLGNSFRQKRMLFFKSKISELKKPISILDVGGNEEFWENAGMVDNPDYQLTIANLDQFEPKYTNIISVIGDATNLSAYQDKQFDIAFSNSVIEHLYNEENQYKMAREMERVAKYYFVQTPNKYFIIEPHYLLPFFDFLPSKMKYFILTETKLSRGKKWDKGFARQYIKEIILLSHSSFTKLFPTSRIWRERFLFMTKSFVAHNFDN